MSEGRVVAENELARVNVGATIRESRKARSWSQTELSDEAGVSRPSIARIERGDDVSTATLAKVAVALGLTIELEAGK